MKYFQILKCQKDPFPNGPSLERYIPAAAHELCLTELQTVVDAKSSPMIVVLGAIGSGKTTISLQLAAKLQENEEINIAATDYAWFSTREKFISHLAGFLKISSEDNPTAKILEDRLLAVIGADGSRSEGRYLLFIDQAEKIPFYCLELLEELVVNGDAAYLQIIAFARPIFESKIGQYGNLISKTNLIKLLQGFSFSEISRVLGWGYSSSETSLHLNSLFTKAGRYYSYFLSQGQPGTALNLCKLTLLSQIVHNCPKAGVILCHQTAKEISLARAKKIEFLTISSFATTLVAMLLSLFVFGHSPISNTISIPEVFAPATPPRVVAQVKAQDRQMSVEISPPPAPPIVPDVETAGKEPEKLLLPARKVLVVPDIPVITKPEKNHMVGHQAVEDGSLEKTDLADMVFSKVKVPEKVHSQHALPKLLGRVSVFERETLGDMIRRIYGPHSFNSKNLASVLKLNPRIRDKQFLNIGDIVNFPVMAVTLPLAGEDLWWVSLITIDELQDAYRYLRIYDSENSLLMIPVWGNNGSFRYRIIMQQSFTNRQDALSELNGLSSQLFPAGRIMEGLDHDVFYYKEGQQAAELQRPVKNDESQIAKKSVSVISGDSKRKISQYPEANVRVLPQNLGKLTVVKGYTLGHMIRAVYGKNSVYPKNIDWLVSNNKDIVDANKIAPGTVLTFPVKAVKISSSSESDWRIRLGSFSTLQEAYSFLRKHTLKKPWLLIIPTFTDDLQKFNVLVEKTYKNEAAVRQRLDKLSQEGFSSTSLLEGISHQKFFFKSKVVRIKGLKK